MYGALSTTAMYHWRYSNLSAVTGANHTKVLAQLLGPLRRNTRYVGLDSVVGQQSRAQVVLDTEEPRLIGSTGVVVAQPTQHVDDFLRRPLRAHLAHDGVQVSLAGADVPVDLEAGRPVLLPGDRPEPHLLVDVTMAAPGRRA